MPTIHTVVLWLIWRHRNIGNSTYMKVILTKNITFITIIYYTQFQFAKNVFFIVLEIFANWNFVMQLCEAQVYRWVCQWCGGQRIAVMSFKQNRPHQCFFGGMKLYFHLPYPNQVSCWSFADSMYLCYLHQVLGQCNFCSEKKSHNSNFALCLKIALSYLQKYTWTDRRTEIAFS